LKWKQRVGWNGKKFPSVIWAICDGMQLYAFHCLRSGYNSKICSFTEIVLYSYPINYSILF
jgi:hypothetical protein